MNKVHFEGEIVKVTRDGRSALVKLIEETSSRRTAIISPSTEGRNVLMNGKGELEVDTHVSGEALVGVDALVATSIEEVSG